MDSAEKFVWMLNKEWLTNVSCFSFVVDRLVARPEEISMQRFLVHIALATQPAVFVPTERLPPVRLYIINEGKALLGGIRLGKGESWGAEDVLLKHRRAENCVRALAVTYLHVLWVGRDTFDRTRYIYKR